jgi:hypothetical protein
MELFPKTKQQWLNLLLFPLEAYIVLAPIMFAISSRMPRPRHAGATEAECYIILGMFPCSIILIFTALVLVIVGYNKTATVCAAFGIAGIIAGYVLLPSLAR